jgi:hypothetical protein
MKVVIDGVDHDLPFSVIEDLKQYQVTPWKGFDLNPDDIEVLREHGIAHPGVIERVPLERVLESQRLLKVLTKMRCRVVFK